MPSASGDTRRPSRSALSTASLRVHSSMNAAGRSCSDSACRRARSAAVSTRAPGSRSSPGGRTSSTSTPTAAPRASAATTRRPECAIDSANDAPGTTGRPCSRPQSSQRASIVTVAGSTPSSAPARRRASHRPVANRSRSPACAKATQRSRSRVCSSVSAPRCGAHHWTEQPTADIGSTLERRPVGTVGGLRRHVLGRPNASPVCRRRSGYTRSGLRWSSATRRVQYPGCNRLGRQPLRRIGVDSRSRCLVVLVLTDLVPANRDRAGVWRRPPRGGRGQRRGGPVNGGVRFSGEEAEGGRRGHFRSAGVQ